MAIADELKIRLPAPDVRPDSEIARNAVLALASQVPYLSGVTPIVHAGEVTLEGEVEWGFQREKAESVVRGLRGVTAVTNLIRVVPRTPTDTVKTEIEQALRRHAELDAGHIVVETRGNRIILRGWVHTLAEREEAERAAWRAPGATHVDNQLSVGEPVESG
jgi:osmotically-inducible protein OsmY